MTAGHRSAAHWDAAYAHGAHTRSWFQTEPTGSLRMLDAARVTAADSLLDVGGGASHLIDVLLARGHLDLTVLDISAAALTVVQQRLGPNAAKVHWLVANLLTWHPARTWRVWHDRAVLHFLTDEPARQHYLGALGAATTPGSIAIIATFAPDGPQQCSGLPVDRYDTADLAGLLGAEWQLLSDHREEHITPGGAVQPFTWAAFRRQP